jgi:GDPmannose 4,6-dehydratase
VREFVSLAAESLGIGLEWTGEGVDEIGTVAGLDQRAAGSPLQVGQVIVRVDPIYFRPAEVETLLGDPTRARQELGWAPKVSFQALVDEMTAADLVLAQREKASLGRGLKVYRPDLEGG